MRLIYELILAMILPVALIWVVGFYATQVSQRSLRSAIEETSAAQARNVIDDIDRNIHTRVANWQAYCRSDLIRETLVASNQEFELKPAADRYIDDEDRKWQETPRDESSPFMLELLNNPLARDLTRRLDALEEASGYRVFGEVFVTNRFGANVAQSHRTSDYRQDDEQWWQAAKEDAVFVGDVNFDDSAGIYSIDLCLRIDGEAGAMLGVLKAVLNIDETLRIVAAHARDGDKMPGREILLFSGDQDLISDGLTATEGLESGTPLFENVVFPANEQTVSIERADAATGERMLASYAHSKGHAGYEGLGWTVMVQHPTTAVFEPVATLRKNILLLAIWATLLAALIGGVLSRSISRRVERVADAAERVGEGDLSVRVPVQGSYEVARLASVFNHMAGELETSAASLRETHRALVAAKATADSANAAKSAFLANMSHEIRTPLNAVIGLTELVLDTPLNDQQRDYLRSVHVSGESLLDVVNDVLDFSKIEAGRLEVEHRVTDHAEVLGDMMKSLSFRAAEKGLELLLRIDPQVPTILTCDAARLRQVLVNLVGNAIKFTERGQITVDVCLDRFAGDAAVVHYAVRDTGIGIAPEKLDRIFEPFEQADASTTRKFGGTGLGLAISSRLVEMMGGRIWAESKLKGGSTFHFTATFDVPRDQPPAISAANGDRLRDMPVLIVDDNQTNRFLLREMVARWDMQPSVADGAVAALAAMRKSVGAGRPIQLVVTDANMPEVDGFELIRRIKQDPALSGTIIVMLSSGDRPGDRDQCGDLGVAAYLIKPIKQSEMLDAILAAVGVMPEVSMDADRSDVPQIRPLRILVAEDSLVNQKLTVGLMTKYGHQTQVANNGREAVELWKHEAFDLILMDVQMPELDGLEATRTIREIESQTGGHTPIVAMTAHAMQGDRDRCLDAGMDDYVSKPVRQDKVFTAITRALRKEDATGQHALEEQRVDSCAAGPRDDAPSTIDWSLALDSAYGDQDLLNDIAGTCLLETAELLNRMHEAVDHIDPSALRLAAHTMKSHMRTFGAATAEHIAFDIENTALDGSVQVDGRLKELGKHVDRLQNELTVFLSADASRK